EKKLIDIGLRYGLQRIWKSGFGRFLPQGGIRILDVEGLILVNQLVTKIYNRAWIARALVLCFAAMVFTVEQV
ncbi:MAG TPA: hypothetical protein VFI06_17165, partial [Chitinophagaceae bacterium]|nr:hypothetical protein [Chitinophagaceae bacterium]